MLLLKKKKNHAQGPTVDSMDVDVGKCEPSPRNTGHLVGKFCKTIFNINISKSVDF